MRADCRVLLDACVLIPMPLADTLLRTAEAPRLYLPKWTQTIMGEVTRNLIAKWEMPADKAQRREEEIRRHFPEAWVEGFEPLIESMTNDRGDRHVLAAAVRSHSDLIVTYNRRHFPPESTQTWEIEIRLPARPLRSGCRLVCHQVARAGGRYWSASPTVTPQPLQERARICQLFL